MPCITFLAAKILCCFKGFYSILQGRVLLPAAKRVEMCMYKCVLVLGVNTHIGVNTHKEDRKPLHMKGFKLF